jgi:hypothetical protein
MTPSLLPGERPPHACCLRQLILRLEIRNRHQSGDWRRRGGEYNLDPPNRLKNSTVSENGMQIPMHWCRAPPGQGPMSAFGKDKNLVQTLQTFSFALLLQTIRLEIVTYLSRNIVDVQFRCTDKSPSEQAPKYLNRSTMWDTFLAQRS